jgi:hypothetical protein
MTNSENSDHAELRAKKAWEQIFTWIAGGKLIPTGDRPSTDATPEELRGTLVIVAATLDALLEQGQLEPTRIRQAMLSLLLVCDSLVPLPEGLLPTPDLREALSALRASSI